MVISNPILTGFHADPSIVRAGNKYYIANSTFEWFPGVRLHESEDLVNWTLVPSPLSSKRMIDMRGNRSSGGVWAPDLTYSDGYYWLVFNDMKTPDGPFRDGINYLTYSDDIRGPWSDPIALNRVGFDASLFHDDNGRKYLVQQRWDHREYHHPFDGIVVTELDISSMKLIQESQRTIWCGDDAKLVEGPHIYKKDGLYYLFAAEGGTVYSHREVVARSESLDELSFVGMPDNPLITNFDEPDGYLQKQGHGALVDTADGEWYYASLCGRPWHHDTESVLDPRGWCTLGRETSLQKVEWDEFGWPKIVGGHNGSRYVEAPHGMETVEAVANHSFHDEFDSSTLGLEWNTLRVPFDGNMGSVGNGNLVLRGQGSLCDAFDLSLIAKRWQDFDFDAETCLSFNPITYQAMAGLTCYYQHEHWSFAFITYDETRKTRVIDVAQNDGGQYTTFMKDAAVVVPNEIEKVWLRVSVRTQWYAYSYSFNGKDWHEIPVRLDAKVLSDEYVTKNYGAGFTGAFVGLAAVDCAGYGTEAMYDYFDYKEEV